jgi:hypothetical protein
MMKVYLHETVDVISGQWDNYQKGIFTDGVPYIDDFKLKLVSFNQVKYSTGRWPEAIAIWEIEDWETYVWEMRDLRVGADHPIGKYMYMAPKWRSGGFDRILMPVTWSPVPPAGYKLGGGVKSPEALFLQQTYKVLPGQARAFVDAMEKNVVSKAGEADVTLEAFWRNTFDPLEYIGLWSLPDRDGFVRFMKSRDPADEGTQLPGLTPVWKHLAGLDERVLLPTAYSPLGGGEKSWASPM